MTATSNHLWVTWVGAQQSSKIRYICMYLIYCFISWCAIRKFGKKTWEPYEILTFLDTSYGTYKFVLLLGSHCEGIRGLFFFSHISLTISKSYAHRAIWIPIERSKVRTSVEFQSSPWGWSIKLHRITRKSLFAIRLAEQNSVFWAGLPWRARWLLPKCGST